MSFIRNKHRVRVILSGLFLLSLFVIFHQLSNWPVRAAGPGEDFALALLGHSGGDMRAIALEGSYAYVAIGSELAILDITDPLNPNRVGYVTLPAVDWKLMKVTDIQVAGDYAYVGVEDSGLHIIDISDPASPAEVGFYEEAYIRGLAVADGYAYLAYGHCDRFRCFGGLSVLTISNPVAPVQVGAFSMPAPTSPYYQMPAQKVAVVGRYVYLTGSGYGLISPFEAGLWVIDVLNPAAPVEVGYIDLVQDGFDIAVAGQYAFVTARFQGLRVINISNPQNPVEVGAYQNGDLHSLTVAGGYAYVSDSGVWDGQAYVGHGLKIISLSDPANPLLAGSYDKGGRVAVTGNLAFVAADAGGFLTASADNLSIVDVTNPAAPVEVAVYDPPGDAVDLAVQADYGYLLDGDKLRILNVSDDAEPVEVGRHTLPENGRHLTVSGSYAYVAADEAGLRIIDVSDPAQPDEVGFLDTYTKTMDVDTQGQYAYLATKESGLRIVDVSDPTAPVEVGFYMTHQLTYDYERTDVIVSGNYAYVIAGRSFIIDISDPGAPVEVAQLSLGDYLDVEVVGQHAYVSSTHIIVIGQTFNGLSIFDLSDPTAPVKVGVYFYLTGAAPYGIAVADGYAYLTAGNGGLCVVDVADAANPVEIGCHQPPSFARAITIANQRIYATREGGLHIMAGTASLTGQVREANGSPVSGVTLSATAGMTTTDQAGQYSFANLPTGAYTITPTLSDFTFIPPVRTATVPRDSWGQNFVMLPQPVSASLTPGLTTTLTFTDTQNLPTQLTFSGDAIAQSATIVVTPTLVSGGAGKASASHAFELGLFQPSRAPADSSFAAPVQVTIHYSDVDVGVISDEAQLTLDRWTANGWENAAQGCGAGSGTLAFPIPAANRFNGLVCQTGRFALLGPTHQLYLPLVFR